MDTTPLDYRDTATLEKFLTEQKKLPIEERLQALERQAVYSWAFHQEALDIEKRQRREKLKKYNLPIPESLQEP